MLKIRYLCVLLGMLLSLTTSAAVQVGIGIGLPHVSIGINVPAYPQLVVVPGYPVYYAPSLRANFFFYDGMYWVYQDDYWYASYWYNGPWWVVGPEVVPVFVLRVPVRYYLLPPVYFRGWRSDAPPRWGDHWGRDWEQRRSGWDRWERNAVPPAAPLPVYQRQYSGDRYPRQVEQQYELQQQNYRYQPRDPVVREHYQEQVEKRAPARQEKQVAPEESGSRQQDMQRSTPRQQDDAGPRSQPPQREGKDVRKSAPPPPPQGRPEAQERKQPPQSEPEQREQQMPRSQGRSEGKQGKETAGEPKQGQGQEKDRGRDLDEE